MLKNNGVPGNLLSNLDPGGVLRDSHNIDLHSLDVNVINSLVPSSFSKVVPTYDEFNRLTNIKYYGLGLQLIQNLVVPPTAQGASEITTFSFTGLNPSDLAGKYVVIYDSIGKVIPWFNLDSGNLEPIVSGATRYIEISIATGDSSGTLTSKFTSIMNSDSEFISQYTGTTSLVSNNLVGERTDATSGNSPVLVAIGQQGINSLSGKLFYLWKADNSNKYAFYFTIDGIGTIPSYTGISITEIAILSTDNLQQIASKIVAKINNIPYFSAKSSGSQITVTYRSSGNSQGFLDVDTGIFSEVVQSGQDLTLVQELIITYETLCSPPIIEALL